MLQAMPQPMLGRCPAPLQAMLSQGAAPHATNEAMHTPRRAGTWHYGTARHTLRHLLRVAGVDGAEYKQFSLLLRMQMLSLAQHDLRYVRAVSALYCILIHYTL